MGNYDGAGSLFGLGMRVTRLGPTGAPLPGVNNSYVTDALVKVDIGLEYEESDEVIQRKGDGRICVSYKAPDSLKRGTIEELQVCTPDPNLLPFIIGGDVIEDADDPAGARAIGYKAPEVGVDPTPNGVGIEVWTRAIIGGSYAATLPYFHWIIPRAFLKTASGMTVSGEDAMVPEFEGFSTQSGGWGTGPDDLLDNDVLVADRVWQYLRVPELPDLDPAFVEIAAPIAG